MEWSVVARITHLARRERLEALLRELEGLHCGWRLDLAARSRRRVEAPTRGDTPMFAPHLSPDTDATGTGINPSPKSKHKRSRIDANAHK